MKLLASILSIYFLGLMAVPCADADISHSNENHIVSVHSEIGDQHGAATDACAPFCSCQCCQTQLSRIDSIDFSVIKPPFYAVQIAHLDHLKQDFLSVFFQPPIV